MKEAKQRSRVATTPKYQCPRIVISKESQRKMKADCDEKGYCNDPAVIGEFLGKLAKKLAAQSRRRKTRIARCTKGN